MAHGDIIWCDLSTIDVARTTSVYADLFGWDYTTVQQPDGSDYHIGATGNDQAAAIFEMPETFQKIGLPSFWMTYFQVDDAQATAELATQLGGKVELGPMPFSDAGRIALIRDPLGAGFTIYDGSDLPPRGQAPKAGHPIWHGLYVSDASEVIPFYEQLFGWTIRDEGQGSHRVMNDKATIGGVEELAEELRGKFEFWGVHFATPDLDQTLTRAKSACPVLTRFDRDGRRTALVQDPDGAAFFLEEVGGKALDVKWKTLIGLALLWGAVVLDQNWVWGLLFLLWTALALKSRDTYFVERISRNQNPGLYWAIMASWVALSLLLFLW